MPFPREEVTPPVTKMYFAATVLSVSSWKIMLRNGKRFRQHGIQKYHLPTISDEICPETCDYFLRVPAVCRNCRCAATTFSWRISERRADLFLQKPQRLCAHADAQLWETSGFALHLNEQSFLILAGAGGATAALYYYDEDIDAWIRPWRDRHPFCVISVRISRNWATIMATPWLPAMVSPRWHCGIIVTSGPRFWPARRPLRPASGCGS